MNPALETLMLSLAGTDDAGSHRALFLGAEPHPAFRQWPLLAGWQPFRPLADAWEKAGLPLVETPAGKWPLVLLLPGKSKDETLSLFAKAHDLLEPGGRIVVSMPNSAGASRFEKELERLAGSVSSVQKNKCRAFRAKLEHPWDTGLLESWRKLGERRTLPGTSFITEPGIFSTDHIDPGSALLVKHLPASLRGKIADLGAGWGFLTDAVLRRCPNVASVDLWEADSRALECAKINLAGHDRAHLAFHWHDVTAGVPGTYDTIVMNPPFHTGQATDVGLGKAFLRSAHGALKRGGKLFLVANRQLPYEAELSSLGLGFRKVAEDGVYKVLFADKRA